MEPGRLRPQAGGELRFAGYAAVFDRVDQGGDVVRPGAFGRVRVDVPLLWEHRFGAVIGRVEMLAEDRRGLRVIGSVSDRRAARLLGAGKVTGLSFGYRVLAQRSLDGASRLRSMLARDERSPFRELTALELVEVSLVAFPMQGLARVHALEAPAD